MKISECLLSAALSLGLATLPSAKGGDGGSRWGADYFPNVELTTHEGRKVRFFEDLIRGRVVVINFIYTSCPDACPLETARLVEVQKVLGERVGRDIFMYSISIDPARDTVAALAEYAERFQIRPGWVFLRGSEEDVFLLRRKLGVLSEEETDLEDHSMSLVIGNQATGRWMRRSPFENAHVLAEEIGGALDNWQSAAYSGEDYAAAPALRQMSRGESLFRTRCSACHIIGEGDGAVRVGPNLQGVTRWRERAWLERWLAEPDVMLAEGDPLALTLFEAYRRVPMPNMRLNEIEVEALIDFIEAETVRTLESGGTGSSTAFGWDDFVDAGEDDGWGLEGQVGSELQIEIEGDAPKSCCLKGENTVLTAEEPAPVTELEASAAEAADAAAPEAVVSPEHDGKRPPPPGPGSPFMVFGLLLIVGGTAAVFARY